MSKFGVAMCKGYSFVHPLTNFELVSYLGSLASCQKYLTHCQQIHSFDKKLSQLFEPTCAYAWWAHMHRFVYVCH